MSKIQWRDVGERAGKTFVQAFVLFALANIKMVLDNPTDGALVAFIGGAGGAALSAAWNVIEDAAKPAA